MADFVAMAGQGHDDEYDEAARASEFRPTRVVVLSEMSTRDKEKYYNMLIESGARFYQDQGQSDEIYIANLRVLAPGVKKEKKKNVGKDGKTVTDNKVATPPSQRLTRLANAGGRIAVNITGVKPFDYSPYMRFVALIAHENDECKPKMRILSWLMKMIEDLYDARFAHEKNDVERDAELSLKLSSSLDSKLQQQVFPVFIYKQLSTVLGLARVVEQNCWDLLCNTDRLRLEYLEVEIFGRFLQEFYDQDDLLFFLYVRSVIASVLHINFRGRWSKLDGPGRQTPLALWMSHRECVQVARVVFGAGNDALCKEFLALINPQMVGQKTDQGDSRRIDITQFLHLAVVGYHQTQSGTGSGAGLGAGAGSGSGGAASGSGSGRSSSPKRFDGYSFPHHHSDPAAAGSYSSGYGSGTGAATPAAAGLGGGPGASMDAYLQLMAGSGGLGGGLGGASAPRGSLQYLASTPIAPGAASPSLTDISSAQWSSPAPASASASASTGTGAGAAQAAAFAQQEESREREFLEAVCAPLNGLLESGSLAPARAEAVLAQMLAGLREKVRLCFLLLLLSSLVCSSGRAHSSHSLTHSLSPSSSSFPSFPLFSYSPTPPTTDGRADPRTQPLRP